jgi:hypothetical protein
MLVILVTLLILSLTLNKLSLLQTINREMSQSMQMPHSSGGMKRLVFTRKFHLAEGSAM